MLCFWFVSTDEIVAQCENICKYDGLVQSRNYHQLIKINYINVICNNNSFTQGIFIYEVLIYVVSLERKKSLKIPKGNHNPYIEEEQTTQWPKEKAQKDKQRSTKHTHKTKDRVTRTPLRTGGELKWSGMVSSSCSTSDTRRVIIVTQWGSWVSVMFLICIYWRNVASVWQYRICKYVGLIQSRHYHQLIKTNLFSLY
jgi:hypothetical protein